MTIALWVFLLLWTTQPILLVAAENEVLPETQTEVVVRHHPQTGEPFISVVSRREPRRRDLDFGEVAKYSRPDYRLLDPKVRSGEIPYDGPYSSRKKVYILAATLATLGTVGSVAGAAAFPATAAASGSATGMGVGAGAVAVSGAATAAAAIKLESEIPDDYSRTQESVLLERGTDFYKLHVAPRDEQRDH